ALGAGPAFAPAADVDDVGMAEEHQRRTAAGTLPHPPDVGSAGREVADRDVGDPRLRQALGEEGHRVRLVAGDARPADEAAERRDGAVAVDGRYRAHGES